MVPEEVLNFTLKWEGGYVNDPHDPGGATNFGITQGTYNRWKKALGQDLVNVKLITHEEVSAIYYKLYWLPVIGEPAKFGFPLSLVLFDSGVNCGTLTAVKFLQRALGVVDDGAWGPKSQAAYEQSIAAIGILGVCKGVITQRRLHYDRIVERNIKLAKFSKGWENRLQSLEKHIGV